MPSDFDVALANMQKYATELPVWLNNMAVFMRTLSDPKAERGVQMASGASNAAKRLGDALKIVTTNLNTQISGSSGSMLFGLTTGFTLTASPPEFNKKTVTGKPWVTASTIAIGFQPPPRTSANESYNVLIDNFVVGTGFDITLYAGTGSAAASDYQVYWVAFPDGVTA